MEDLMEEALERAIVKWEGYIKAETALEAAPADCPLCAQLFYMRPSQEDCVGCPVYQKTGKSSCHDSPYYKASNAWDNWYFGSKDNEDEARDNFRALAGEEVEFLKSCRKLGN